MRGLLLGEVANSRHAGFKAGDRVTTLGTWSDYYCAAGEQFVPLPSVPGLDDKEVFGIYGLVGPTAYFGLVDVGAPRIGDTLVVSTAAGAVGSLVGQIGKALGCRVVGIAGGRDKCAWVTGDLGFDAAIDYKSQDLTASL